MQFWLERQINCYITSDRVLYQFILSIVRRDFFVRKVVIGSMAYSKRGNHSADRGGKRNFRDRNSPRPSMHKATCSECGKSCEVPFKPTGRKPIYCSKCFETKGDSGPRQFKDYKSERRFSDRRDSGDKKMFSAICADCGNSCEVPFKPSPDKKVFCSKCFSKGGPTSNKSSVTNEQFDLLNDKLDKIIKLISFSESIEKVQKKPASKKAKVVKPKKIKKKKSKANKSKKKK